MLRRHAHLAALVLAVAAAAVPLGATAQPAPDIPSYARPIYGSTEETLHGSISAFDGGFALQLHDDRGFLDNIRLAPGTIINPTGLRLEPGMTVTVHGVNRGGAFAADDIETPYQSYGAVPVYPYGPYPYPVYPAYPVYPYAVYPYSYEPRFSFGFHIGPRFRRGFR